MQGNGPIPDEFWGSNGDVAKVLAHLECARRSEGDIHVCALDMFSTGGLGSLVLVEALHNKKRMCNILQSTLDTT